MEVEIITERIEELSKKKGISRTKALSESGAGKDFISNLKKGQTPSIIKLQKIAEFFGVSVDYILGRTEASTSNNVVTGSSNTIQNGNNNVIELRAEGALTINNPAVAEAYESLTEREKLSVQMFILDTAEAKKKEKEKKD